MFKSILGRLFWTYAIILMLVFTSVAVTVGIFVNHFAISTHMNNVISVSQNLEYWTGSLQIEVASPPLPAQAELYKLCGSAVPGSAAKRIRKALNHLIDDPLRISMTASAVCDTAEIRQLQQELDTLLQTPPVDEDTARQKALEVASLKLASVKTEEYESHRLRGIFETHPKMDALDAALLKQSLRKIECHGDTVCLLLKNGQWLEA